MGSLSLTAAELFSVFMTGSFSFFLRPGLPAGVVLPLVSLSPLLPLDLEVFLSPLPPLFPADPLVVLLFVPAPLLSEFLLSVAAEDVLFLLPPHFPLGLVCGAGAAASPFLAALEAGNCSLL